MRELPRELLSKLACRRRRELPYRHLYGANVRPIAPALADAIGHSSGRDGNDETGCVATRATFGLQPDDDAGRVQKS